MKDEEVAAPLILILSIRQNMRWHGINSIKYVSHAFNTCLMGITLFIDSPGEKLTRDEVIKSTVRQQMHGWMDQLMIRPLLFV